MKYIAHINIMPLQELLDPQGKAVNSSLHNLGISQVERTRIGKHVTLEIAAAEKTEATQIATEACRKLLANPVMEYFEVEVSEA
jgi:phosphoribosylformylglycinamidine synthase subunit PurS